MFFSRGNEGSDSEETREGASGEGEYVEWEFFLLSSAVDKQVEYI